MTELNFLISVPGLGRGLRPGDPNFSDEIRRLIANVDSENDRYFSAVDDSDTDLDFVKAKFIKI